MGKYIPVFFQEVDDPLDIPALAPALVQIGVIKLLAQRSGNRLGALSLQHQLKAARFRLGEPEGLILPLMLLIQSQLIFWHVQVRILHRF